MNYIITSDLHLGSEFSHWKDFAAFLKNLPADSALILNGDTVNLWGKLSREEEAIIDLLRKESMSRRVILVRGNHDLDYKLKDPGYIEQVSNYVIEGKVFISHGDEYDGTCFYRKWLAVSVLLFLYSIYTRCGGKKIHPASYAKKFHRLFESFKSRTVKNAVAFAKRSDYETIVCGHTHSVDDITVDGVRFLNTGCWTEKPLMYISVTDKSIELRGIVD